MTPESLMILGLYTCVPSTCVFMEKVYKSKQTQNLFLESDLKKHSKTQKFLIKLFTKQKKTIIFEDIRSTDWAKLMFPTGPVSINIF